MLIGYARVSTHDQTLALQQDALQQASCGRVFTDTASGAKAERRGLEEALNFVRAGDTLVVWRLDRLGRSLPHLIKTLTDLHERGIGFRSLTEQIDTTTSGGKLIFHVFAALAGRGIPNIRVWGACLAVVLVTASGHGARPWPLAVTPRTWALSARGRSAGASTSTTGASG